MKKSENFFLDKERFKIIDTLRILYFVIFLLSFALTEIGRNIYRPYIYQNNISDFGIADSIGNLVGIIVQIFFGLTIINSLLKKGIRIIFFFMIGYIIYEIAQPILPRGTFDLKDIYGTLIGGVFALIIFIMSHKLMRNNKVLTSF
jgi:hypothetical protein